VQWLRSKLDQLYEHGYGYNECEFQLFELLTLRKDSLFYECLDICLMIASEVESKQTNERLIDDVLNWIISDRWLDSTVSISR
jgi:hypothetical protein